jgi:DNA-directed RNA polymerase subunit beta'
VIVGRLIPAGTGLAYHLERKSGADQLESEDVEGSVPMDTSEVEEALKQALSQ